MSKAAWTSYLLLAAAVAAVLGGANLLRVHDVAETCRAARMADAIRFGFNS